MKTFGLKVLFALVLLIPVSTIYADTNKSSQTSTSVTTLYTFDATKYSKNDLKYVVFGDVSQIDYQDKFTIKGSVMLKDGTSKDVKVSLLVFNHLTGKTNTYNTTQVKSNNGDALSDAKKKVEANEYAYRRVVLSSEEIKSIKYRSMYLKVEYKGQSLIKCIQDFVAVENARYNVSTLEDAVNYFNLYAKICNGDIRKEINGVEWHYNPSFKELINKTEFEANCGRSANMVNYLLSDDYEMGYVQYYA